MTISGKPSTVEAKMATSERRNKVRSKGKGQVVFHFAAIGADGRRTGPAHGLLLDYSLAGIRFVTEEQLRKNTELYIELEFTGLGSDCEEWRNLWEESEADRLQVIGTVMWCQEKKGQAGHFEVGTRFVEKAGVM